MNNQVSQISAYTQISTLLLIAGIILLIIAIGMFLRFRIHKTIGRITGNEEKKEKVKFTKHNLEYEQKQQQEIISSREAENDDETDYKEYGSQEAEDLSVDDSERETDILGSNKKKKKKKINLPKEAIDNIIEPESETDVLKDETLTDILTKDEAESQTDLLREVPTENNESEAETGLLDERMRAENNKPESKTAGNRGKFNIVNETVVTHGKEKK